VHLGPQVSTGGPVREVHLHLDYAVALARQVDGERRLDAEPAGERARRVEGRTGEAALPV
jgi:hypothetical protein